MQNWSTLIKSRVFLICILYMIIHVINLTVLPIFNDESIYLDWGWTHTHMPGHLYDALIDAKQPFMIWIFGLFENFFQDPLFAGRFASVLIGLITLIGIYKLAKQFFLEHVALFAAFLYAITPIFAFYNRQALFESGVMSIGIWSCYALVHAIRKPTTRNSIVLGVILGIGFFIKSSALLFVIAATAVIIFQIVVKKEHKLIKSYFIAFGAFVAVDLLLFINPLFWQTFSSNSRYAFTLGELFTFPIVTWVHNLLGFFEIGFVFITPLIFVSSIIGFFMMKKQKIHQIHIYIIFFFIALLLEILSGKTQSQRYIVPFLPFLVISAAYVLSAIWKKNVYQKGVVVGSLLIPVLFTSLVVISPEQYILTLSKVSRYADTAYTSGQTSGHGIHEAVQYITDHSNPDKPAMVLFGFNIGNPESAINIYTQNTHNQVGLHVDAQLFEGIDTYDCITSAYPTFLVTRNDQRLGMDRFFVLEKAFPNPDKNYSVRIYTIKNGCKGNTFSLSDVYQPSINAVLMMRN